MDKQGQLLPTFSKQKSKLLTCLHWFCLTPFLRSRRHPLEAYGIKEKWRPVKADAVRGVLDG